MIKNNNYLDSLSKNLLNDVRSVMEGKKGCSKECNCEKCEEKDEVKEEKKMKGEDPCWKDYNMVGTKKGKGGKEVPNCVPEETEIKTEAYNKGAVDKAIKSSRQKIGGKEAKLIHALLKGRTGQAAKNAEDTNKTFPNVKHLTKDGHPDWKKHGIGEEAEQIDEISKKLATDYFHAKQDKARKDFMRGRPTNKKGVMLAKAKIEGDAKVPATRNEEVQIDEEVDFAKVRKQFDRNEDRNAHSVNAVLIAKHAGTDEHHKEAKDILKQHNKLGYLSGDLMKRRKALYDKLEKTDNYKKIFPEHKVNEEAKMTYKKMLGQHTVYKGDKMHRSFPTEHDAMQHIKKNQGEEAKKKTYSYNEEVELDEAKAESPIKGTRLISKHEGKDGHHAEVRHNPDWNEFQVHHYENGKHMGEGPVSYHDTKADAKETAEYEVKNYRPKGGSLHKEETISEKLIGKQHKLDKNKNGKLDKQDFKMLRKEETIEEKLAPSMGASKYITDFVKSKDPRFEGKTKKERIKMALGAYYGAKNEAVEVDQIDEISSDLAARYVEKSRPDRGFGDEQKARLSQTKRDNRQRYGNVAREKIFAGKNKDKETSVRVAATNEEVQNFVEGYGDKRDYKKHHISVNGKYIATTTWAKDAKEAEKKFIEAHPEHKNARITVVKER